MYCPAVNSSTKRKCSSVSIDDKKKLQSSRLSLQKGHKKIMISGKSSDQGSRWSSIKGLHGSFGR